ncbi:hypothetical protein [Hymenobacter cavernae]|uniref:Uncharacterized protein n=1 Tax=Hymenobacter cavernae TaxID=2044852 RepID=A0ABQ1TIR7_9BACT|nr:hypothetical protein [Hymenobacter cavernae]GGE95592.1 hypothetical protein GCM10011383_02920 [Hymenobacter cavernae]
MANRSAATRATLVQTLIIWLVSNLGGTFFLALLFGLDHPTDVAIALIGGMLAALLSLFLIPLWVPFFALINCVECRRTQFLAMLLGSVTFYFIANLLLLYLLPLGTLDGVMEMTFPYLLSAFIAITYMYRTVLPLPVGPPNVDLFKLDRSNWPKY